VTYLPHSRKPNWIIQAPVVGVIWILGCGFVDWLTGTELALSAFYLPGIILAAWFGGRKASLWLALLGAVVWLAAELMGTRHYSRSFIVYWNSTIRLSIFTVTALLTSEVRIRRLTEAALQSQKEILASILDSMRDGVVVADGEGSIILFNPAAKRLFGDVADNENAIDWVDRLEKKLLNSTTSCQDDKNMIRKAIVERQPGQGEIALLHGDKPSRIQLGVTTLPLTGKSHHRSGVVIIFNDLTARRNLENQISQASEREQRRIGQDLHDGICQHLVGVTFAVGTLRTDLERLGLPAQAGKVSEIGELIREGIQQTRDLARGLYPMGIEEGLDIALGLLAATTTERLDIPCHYSQRGEDFKLDSITAGHFYRIAQEAVSNAVKHSSPTSIQIRLSREAGSLTLEISDDGKGISSSNKSERGIGLQIMQYRANLVGAKLKIISQEGVGTCILCQTSLAS